MTKSLVPVERIQRSILVIRGLRVMIDADLAELYGVSTGRMNEQVARNRSRFPGDFMFQLTKDEYENLKSHFATSSEWGGRPKLPNALNEATDWLLRFGVSLVSGALGSTAGFPRPNAAKR